MWFFSRSILGLNNRSEQNWAGFPNQFSEGQPFLFAVDRSIEKTKRTGFIEKWAKAEETSAFLGITLYAVIGFCVVLLVTLFKVSTKPQAIYYIPSAQEAGIAYPNRIDKAVICGFASNWLLNRNNFTPATAKDIYIRAMR